VAWDGRAQRLAVALGGAHPAAGSVALYDTRCDPIVSARFTGFMRLGPLQPPAPPAAGAEAAGVGGDWEEIQPEEVAEAAGATGSAAGGAAAAARRSGGSGGSAGTAAGTAAAAGGSPPAELAFMPGFAQGALLAARRGDHIAAVPMFFAA
jgi:hypothetical protein